MKMKAAHIVLLSQQAIAVLEALQALTSSQRWLFLNTNTAQKPMSETPFSVHSRIGYHARMTGHSFRGLASTILNEHGFNSDRIERQLAHVEQNGGRAAYNHAEYLAERRKMNAVVGGLFG
jgi:integrase